MLTSHLAIAHYLLMIFFKIPLDCHDKGSE